MLPFTQRGAEVHNRPLMAFHGRMGKRYTIVQEKAPGRIDGNLRIFAGRISEEIRADGRSLLTFGKSCTIVQGKPPGRQYEKIRILQEIF